jgi:integrase/recombinase XerD
MAQGAGTEGSNPFVPDVHGERISADSVQPLLATDVHVASESCASLKSKQVSPHVLRHYVASRTMSRTVRALQF